MAGNRKQILGRWGEQVASTYLAQKGYTLLASNYRTPFGELDLVARQKAGAGWITVFIEVKTRSTGNYGFPEEAVTAEKRRHLMNSAEAYLERHPEQVGDWRIDVIAIRSRRLGEDPEIVHYENAVNGD